MQQFQNIPPVGILFDCCLGEAIEDVLALAVLHGLDGRGECRLVANTVSTPNLQAAAFTEVLGRFYAGQPAGELLARVRLLPAGMPAEGKASEDSPMLPAVLERKTGSGGNAYRHSIERLTDTADPVVVLRNALSAQHPGNAVLVASGPLTNVARLMRHRPAEAFVKQRCRLLVVAAGRYAPGKPDAAIARDAEAAQQVFAEWPTPIVAVGRETGEAVPFPGDSVGSAFGWTEYHPVADAYRAFRAMPYDATTAALAAVLYAARPQAPYFQLSEPGTITVKADGSTRLEAGGAGRHRILTVNPEQRAPLQEAYLQLASAKPVPRGPRRPPPPPMPEAPKPPSGASAGPGAKAPGL